MNRPGAERRRFIVALTSAWLCVACVHEQPATLDDYVMMQRRSMSMDESQWPVSNSVDTGSDYQDNRIRRALLRASPGRSAEDLALARDSLKEILTSNDAPQSAALRDYLVLTLRMVEQRLSLQTETATAARRSQALEAELAETQRRLRELEQARADAEQKLKALTKIEKSIERPSQEQSE